jgi:hypothetical protein
LDASALQGLQAFEAGLEAHGGEALLRIGGAPAAFARPVGRGWALYLNALMDGYPELRKAGYGGSAVRGLLSALLERLEVRPSVVVRDARGQAVGPLRVARYRFGDSDVVGLLLEPVDLDAAHGRDGVTVYDDTRLGRVAAREVEVHLPRAGNVVDTRTGRLLARSDRVRTSLVAGEALVLAVSQERPVPGVRGPSTAAPGDHVGFSVSSEAPSRRLVRCHVHGPDGKRVPWYERNLLVEGGEASLVVPTALDDPTGRYRIQVEDVLAGTAAETALEVR